MTSLAQQAMILKRIREVEEELKWIRTVREPIRDDPVREL